METISQRELRNNSAAVIRGLERGVSYRITNRGVPVGTLTPATGVPFEEHLTRRGTQDMDLPAGCRVPERTADVLDEMRHDR